MKNKTYIIVVTAILAALSVVMHLYIKFPIPPFPPFLQIHFSDIPTLIAALMLGPVPAAVIVAVKFLIKVFLYPDFPIPWVGDIADLIISLSFVLPVALLRGSKRCFNINVFVKLLIGALCSIAAAIIINITFLLPFYIKLGEGSGITLENIVLWCSEMIPSINKGNFYPLYAAAIVLPFNLIKNTVIVTVVWVVLKRLKINNNRICAR